MQITVEIIMSPDNKVILTFDMLFTKQNYCYTVMIWLASNIIVTEPSEVLRLWRGKVQ